ncbi:hypothetical protein D9M71_799580 [compost metagenome]
MEQLANHFKTLDDPNDDTNKVLTYLLGKEDQPVVADVLRRYYESSYQYSREWILTGQRHGVIPPSIDADEIADMLLILSLGLRVRSTIPGVSGAFGASQFSTIVSQILKSR